MDGLSPAERKLIERATEALKNAYSPYSKFRVGAALRASDGQIYAGCNVENSSYGLTNCAERTAIFKAVSEGDRDFEEMAIVVETAEGIGTPCGSCRQVMIEFSPDLDVIMANTAGDVEKMKAAELLPKSFVSEQLDEEKVQPKK